MAIRLKRHYTRSGCWTLWSWGWPTLIQRPEYKQNPFCRPVPVFKRWKAQTRTDPDFRLSLEPAWRKSLYSCLPNDTDYMIIISAFWSNLFGPPWVHTQLVFNMAFYVAFTLDVSKIVEWHAGLQRIIRATIANQHLRSNNTGDTQEEDNS